MDALSEANGTFAFHLLKILCQDSPSSNVFYSPVNISSALARVFLRAKGSTAAQMAQNENNVLLKEKFCGVFEKEICFQALSLNLVKDIHQGFQSLLSKLNKSHKQYLLRMANRFFGEMTCIFLSSHTEYFFPKIFHESCLPFYHAELEQLSFAKATKQSRKHINTWVSKQTEGKIRELLPGNSIDADTRLLLVNAIYFKGRWNEQLNKTYTREMPFNINQKEQRPVQMMFREATFKLACIEEVQAQLLELPYAGEELSMLILLPDDHVDLSLVEENPTFEKFRAWTKPDHLRNTDVEVFLTKFKLEGSYDMESVLQRLGIVDVFQWDKVDFSAVSAGRHLCLSKLVHKSFMEVNEEGTEAAAASAELVTECCMVYGARIWADHPFLVFI
ncbi:hypothetical protein MC885_015088 [Smutsia gigantea]|nr:hypothetical protein MC885_015088 [Smutsia gigantea]